MSKRVYISADYSTPNGDRDVVDELHKWGKDNYHKVDIILILLKLFQEVFQKIQIADLVI